MSRTFFVPPADFHVLVLAGRNLWIDSETRKEVESFLRNAPGPYDSITVTTLIGEELTVIADAVNSIYDSTPAIRDAERAMHRALEHEIPVCDR